MKKILVVCICLSIMTLSSTAHTVESDLYHHVQCTGWDVYEDSKHWGGSNTIMTVSCGDFDGEVHLDPTLKMLLMNGIAQHLMVKTS